MKKASVLTLSSSTNSKKGYSIKHCLASVWSQDVNFSDIEVVIAENSRDNKQQNLELIRKTVVELNDKFQKVDYKLVDVNPAESRGKGRNIGAKETNSDLLIFLDDDTILYSKNAIDSVLKKAKKTDYGYGANRLWTNETWFQDNYQSIYHDMIQDKDPFSGNITFAPSMIRGSEDIRLQHFTFISNWGYCKKELFNKVGGYPDFQGRDLEDDFLTFLLFKESGNYGILFQTSVIHVTHKIIEFNFSNTSLFYDKLKAEGYFWFNIDETFQNEKPGKNKVLQKLGPYHLDYRIEEAYEEYLKVMPPFPNDQKEILKWSEQDQLSAQEFALQIKKLISSKSLDQFVSESHSHFDDLIPIIIVVLQQGLLSVSETGEIIDKLNFKHFPNREIKNEDQIDDPNESFNQFPCTVESRDRRVLLLHERFPLTDHMSVGIIGDDDLVSAKIAEYRWLEALVVEVDEAIINRIPKESSIEILRHDLREYPVTKQVKKVKTFITDPPYTLHGVLLFTLHGLSLMEFGGKKEEEFFVILNPSMIGRYMIQLQKVLSGCGIWVHQVREDFSQYRLPDSYTERRRADDLLEKFGIQKETLKLSSSSNLYIMRSITPDIDKLKSMINFDEIYNHFV